MIFRWRKFFEKRRERNLRLSYYTGLGFAVATWSSLEIRLDVYIKVIFEHLGGEKISPEFPRSFRQKIRFFKSAIKLWNDSSGFKERSVELIGEIEELAKRRNSLVHSAATQFDIREGKFLLAKMQVLSRSMQSSAFWENFDQIESFVVDANELIFKMDGLYTEWCNMK